MTHDRKADWTRLDEGPDRICRYTYPYLRTSCARDLDFGDRSAELHAPFHSRGKKLRLDLRVVSLDVICQCVA